MKKSIIFFSITLVLMIVGCDVFKNKEIAKAENIIETDYFSSRPDVKCEVVDSYWLNNQYVEVVAKCVFKNNVYGSKPFNLFFQFDKYNMNYYNCSNYSKQGR